MLSVSVASCVSVRVCSVFTNVILEHLINYRISSKFLHLNMKPEVPHSNAQLQRANILKFKFTDYDCIGFDLDNTLARYKVGAMIDLEYSIMANYLVNRKGYAKEYFSKPLDHHFIVKGLIVDDFHGNLLRIDSGGTILQSSHGTRMMTGPQIEKCYPNRHWEGTDAFAKNPIGTWNGPYTEVMRTLLDYYDICVSAIFAMAVDYVDIHHKKQNPYKVWPDILECLIYMFNREHFKSDTGEYFPALKQNPEKYYYKCSSNLIHWITELKNSGKILFLITGSHVDFASHTALNTLGPKWKDLFDITVCFAKKPGFFFMNREFLSIEGYEGISWRQCSGVCAVQFRREVNTCTVKAKITSESNIERGPYNVTVIIDQEEELCL